MGHNLLHMVVLFLTLKMKVNFPLKLTECIIYSFLYILYEQKISIP